MINIFNNLNLSTQISLITALIFVLFYEIINGFHDTANAVATVIYTRSMHAKLIVIMTGIFNFFGVLFGGLSVAYVIIHMLPTNLLVNFESTHSIAMVFSMLSVAIIWNLGTWFIGLPASSSHTLIGSIIGIGITNALVTGSSLIKALNISQITSIFLSLIISPILGLLIAGSLMFILRFYFRNNTTKHHRIHMTPLDREKIDGKKKPPFWIRVALIVSSNGVSYSHGANDGQKGIGLIMLILIGINPAGFVVNMNSSNYDIIKTRDAINHLEKFYNEHSEYFLFYKKTLQHKITPLSMNVYVSSDQNAIKSSSKKNKYNSLKKLNCCNDQLDLYSIKQAQNILNNVKSYNQLSVQTRIQIRQLLLCISDNINKIISKLPNNSKYDDKHYLNQLKIDLLKTIEYAPIWIIIVVALALGIGTMIGWRRITITISEKIGKRSMTYAQGMCAQITAAIAIGIASYTGLPVSTTHTLSSSLAGAMLVDKNKLQNKTIQNIIMSWLLTLPVCIILSGLLYWIILHFS